jgi:hypothetical protein
MGRRRRNPPHPQDREGTSTEERQGVPVKFVLRPPPSAKEGSEEARFRRALEEAERQGTLSRLIPRPRHPMDMAQWQAKVRRRALRKDPWVGSGRKRGPPFRDRDDCLAWLREKAAVLAQHDTPITFARVGGLSIGQKGIRTEDPTNAGKTISRWCQALGIKFEDDVKKYF